MRLLSFALVMSLGATAGAVGASEGRALKAYLVPLEGERIHVADISLSSDGSYELGYAEAPFGDYFLSMRPFRCIAGPDKHWCHLPYPYENRRNISNDLADLEYDFLFIWKEATDYGIDTWNGVYYQIAPDGSGWRGVMHDVDMDVLAVPPDAGNFRPLQDKHTEEAEAEGHWLPYLVIE